MLFQFVRAISGGKVAEKPETFAFQREGRAESRGEIQDDFLFASVFFHAAVVVETKAWLQSHPPGTYGFFTKLLFRGRGEHGKKAEEKPEGGDVAFRRSRRDQPVVPCGDAVCGYDAVTGRSFQRQCQGVPVKGGVDTELPEAERLELRFTAGELAYGGTV